MSKIADQIKAKVQDSMFKAHVENRKNDRIGATVAASVKQAMVAEAEVDEAPVNPFEGEKIEYYLGRACEELANRLKDIRFESDNNFTGARCEIIDVTTADSGETKVSVIKQLNVIPTRETKSEVDSLLGKLRSLAIPTKFASYLSVSSNAGDDGASVELNIIFNLPAEYLEVIGANDFLKRPTIIAKEIKKLVEDYLNN